MIKLTQRPLYSAVFCILFLAAGIGMLLTFTSAAVYADDSNSLEAPDLTKSASLTITGGGAAESTLTDRNPNTFISFVNDGEIIITAPEGERISALYIVWRTPPELWYIDAEDNSYTGGENGFLHETIKLDEPATEAVLHWEYRQAYLADIYILGEGSLPDWVQQWEVPEGPADLLLFPTHADDEHLYFGGTMPYYSSRGDVILQVCYMVNHNGEPYRLHEQLDGLWTAGIRRYPIIPEFPDVYSNSLDHARSVYNKQEILAYQTEMIRRFQPLVIIGHDLKGEYGHGAHMLNALCLTEVIENTNDPSYFPESYEEFGGWQTSKLYLHLYNENQIVMEWDDLVLANPFFQGQTALETAVKAFDCHVSQQDWFQVEASGPYDCRKFGLYFTNVGLDENGGDFFEHLELPRMSADIMEDIDEPEDDVILPVEVLPESSSESSSAVLDEEIKEVLPANESAQPPEDDKPKYLLRIVAWAAGGISLALAAILFLVGRLQKDKKKLRGKR